MSLDTDRLRTRIHEHLSKEASEGDGARLLALTLRGIAMAVDEKDLRRVARALKKLEADEDVLKEEAPLRIFVPTSNEGRAVLGHFAREGYVGFSPWAAAVWGLILSILVLVLVRTTNPQEITGQTPTEAYWNGVIAGGALGGMVALLIGRMLWAVLAEYRRAKLGYEDRHARVVTPMKYAGYISCLGLLAYYALWVYPGRNWDFGHVLAIIALAVAFAFPLDRALRQR